VGRERYRRDCEGRERKALLRFDQGLNCVVGCGHKDEVVEEGGGGGEGVQGWSATSEFGCVQNTFLQVQVQFGRVRREPHT
jgi:hypothetical protein